MIEYSDICTIVSAIATTAMAIATFITIRQSKLQMTEIGRPRIVFSIVAKDGLFCLKIANVGNSAAYNLKLSFSEEFVDKLLFESYRERFRNMSNTTLFLEANSEKYIIISHVYDSGTVRADGEQHSGEEINKWIDNNKNTKLHILGSYNEKYKIDETLSIAGSMYYSVILLTHEERTLDKISNTLLEINKTIKNLQKNQK